LLKGFLEYHRRVASGKLSGRSEEDARRHLAPARSGGRSQRASHARDIGPGDVIRERIDGATVD
jgi:hypothetical protein